MESPPWSSRETGAKDRAAATTRLRDREAVTGIPRGRLPKEVEADFPTLPAGCVMQLDRVARERILASLRQALRGGEQRRAGELRAAGPMTLAAFVEHTGRTLEQPLPQSMREMNVVAHVADGSQELVSEYLRSLPPGTRSKGDIDRQIREERDSWTGHS